MKNRMMIPAALAATLLAAACGGGKKDEGAAPTPTPDPNEHVWVQEARVQFPNFLDLQTNVISSTCSPNPGVCHNSSNYPNLETAGNTLAHVGAPCNVEIPDPTQGWDSCERHADYLRASTGGGGGAFTSRIAWMEHVGPGTWNVGFEDPAPGTQSRRVDVLDADMNPVFQSPADWQVNVALVQGTNHASLTVGGGDDFIRDYVDSILQTVIEGDPNRNGTWGAESAAVEEGALIYPGDPARSYLWGRLTGTVPGFRMPLANAPLTNPAYVALACWIEQLAGDDDPQAEDAIDYTNCSYADAPEDHAVTE